MFCLYPHLFFQRACLILLYITSPSLALFTLFCYSLSPVFCFSPFFTQSIQSPSPHYVFCCLIFSLHFPQILVFSFSQPPSTFALRFRVHIKMVLLPNAFALFLKETCPFFTILFPFVLLVNFSGLFDPLGGMEGWVEVLLCNLLQILVLSLTTQGFMYTF